MTHERVPQDDFELLLTQQLQNAAPYINDDGFSSAVMQRLPKVKKPLVYNLWFVLVASLCGILMGAFALSAIAPAAVHWVNTLDLATIIQLGLWGLFLIVGGFVVWLSRQLDWV